MTQLPGGPAPRPVLLLSSDLLFRSRIDDVARRLGFELRVATSAERLERHLANGVEPSVAVVDLECDTLDAAGAIGRLRGMPWGTGLRIVAYAGHTNVAALRAGRTAGAEVVLPRSAFVTQLPALLERVAQEERERGGAAGGPPQA